MFGSRFAPPPQPRRKILVKHRKREDAGFTLIELLIVIIILGILATIVLLGTGTFRSDADTAACGANAKIMNTAEGAYAAQHQGQSAAGDTAKLQTYIRDAIPTSGTGAVRYDADASSWVCV